MKLEDVKPDAIILTKPVEYRGWQLVYVTHDLLNGGIDGWIEKTMNGDVWSNDEIFGENISDLLESFRDYVDNIEGIPNEKNN